jgi:putative SOS response-associated peptidase YedK
VAPTQDVGVVVNQEGSRLYKTMRWGLIPAWAKDMKIGSQCINARLDSAATKPAFRAAWKERRLLVPAPGYFEWREIPVPGQKKPLKQPFYVSRKDGLPLTFAGLWERWGKEKLLSFTILTTEACNGIKDLHTRMPVILDASGLDTWLDGGDPVLDANLGGVVRVTPVSPRVNKPAYNEPDCIAPLVEDAPMATATLL